MTIIIHIISGLLFAIAVCVDIVVSGGESDPKRTLIYLVSISVMGGGISAYFELKDKKSRQNSFF